MPDPTIGPPFDYTGRCVAHGRLDCPPCEAAEAAIGPPFDSCPMPTSEAEWRAHWAFYRLTVAQRDAAWRTIERLERNADAR